jgi:isopentenyl-diphosphate delta-isomerase
MDDGRVHVETQGADPLADADTLILVDEADREVGHMSKALCHDGRGILHRAFSLFIFNAQGDLLLQQRSASKRLWPLYWSNSCCSHPRRFESMETAVYRRLYEELGVYCPLEFLFKFQYQAQWDAHGAENELCSVYIGHTPSQIQPDPAEIAGVRWVSPEQLQAEMAQRRPGQFTPWFIMEWERVWNDHRPVVVSTRS